MKKIYLLLSALALSAASFAQTIDNAGMETWRSNTSGDSTIHAPTSWFGVDSLIIGVGTSFLGSTNWHPQLFQSTTIKNSGTSAAKLMTRREDTLGIFPGILTNAQPSFDLTVIISGGDPASAITFSGGTNTNLRIMTVSAFVEYFPGFDSGTTTIGHDTASLSVQAYSASDAVVGTGTVSILPHSSFTQVTANLTYTDTVNVVTHVRMFFASSGNNGKDSSTLYVDDVSMTGVAQTSHEAVASQNMQNNAVKVYPNPASGVIHFDAQQHTALTCKLISVSGQVVANKAITGNGELDVTALPAGMYYYNIADASGKTIQTGKVTVAK